MNHSQSWLVRAKSVRHNLVADHLQRLQTLFLHGPTVPCQEYTVDIVMPQLEGAQVLAQVPYSLTMVLDGAGIFIYLHNWGHLFMGDMLA